MSKINDLLITEAENHLSALLTEKLPDNIIYHNFDHALLIKKYAETIGEQEGLTAEEMNILRISALFHEVGYVNSFEQCHEESIVLASAFLEEHGVDPQIAERVSEVIRATKLPQSPQDKIAEVLCDADMMYIASEGGIEQFDLIYDETALVKPNLNKRPVFEKGYIDFYTKHSYFTQYGKTILQPKKEAAVKRLSDRLKRRKMLESKKEGSVKKTVSYTRGVDTMFRITARNQINLNSIADNKSNILISVNAIIISIIITMLAGNIGNMSKDILPILVFLIICLVTIIIAILSTRPNIVTTRFTEEDIRKKKVDLIFFGNFIKLNYDDYLKEVKEMMKDEDHVYSTLIKNQYSLGKILSKKFRLVRMAYNIFMVGIIFTVIVFLLNYLLINRPA
jgi:predicted metal-dependent HD superfamily phosphohydrolase